MLRNDFEKKISRQLKKRKKITFTYEGERLDYIIHGRYLPDFVIELSAGKYYLELKGYLRPEDKRKLAAVKKQHAEKDLRILFYRYNSKDIKWAEKLGFKYAISKIPKEWLE